MSLRLSQVAPFLSRLTMPGKMADLILQLVKAGLLEFADNNISAKVTSSGPQPGIVRDRSQFGEPLIPFLFLSHINVSFHNTLTADGRLSISISTDPKTTRRVDAILTSFATVQQPLVLAIGSSYGIVLGYVISAYPRQSALCWRLQLQPLAEVNKTQSIGLHTIQSAVDDLDKWLVAVARVKTMLQRMAKESR